jgi:hypothetical protein
MGEVRTEILTKLLWKKTVKDWINYTVDYVQLAKRDLRYCI